MTEKGVERRIEFWRRRLCPELRVSITTDAPSDPPPGEWVACVDTALAISEARIYYRADEVADLDTYAVDRIVVHELLHPLLDRVLNQDEALRPYVGAVQWEVFVAQRNDAEEELVNRLAHAIVDERHGIRSFSTRQRGTGPQPRACRVDR